MSQDTITSPEGFQAAGIACGIKESGAPDLGLLVSETPCAAAALFTRNRFCGAPVVIGRRHVKGGRLRAVVVNSGCANVATGKRGLTDAQRMCREAAGRIGCDPHDVLPSSTGLIGEYLPMDRIRRGIGEAHDALSGSAAAGKRFARAIMTTDTKIKQASARFRIGKSRVMLAGCAKGSGMIAPNMATMLAFLTSDATIPARALRGHLVAATEATFNRVTVDECPSTSDTVMIMASGRSARVASQRESASFAEALREVCEALAYQIVADGEGATRVLEVRVVRARSSSDAHTAARAIAASPLVKTAVHGGDPNWGRIIQALGSTAVTFKPQDVVVKLDGTTLFRRGAPSPRLDMGRLGRAMRRKHVAIEIDLNAGKASDRVLTCDFSREYVTINADYHT